jgi:hypothetical protein
MNSALTRGRRSLGCLSVCSRRKSHTGEPGVSVSRAAYLRTFPSDTPHVPRARRSCLQSMGKPSICTGTPRAPPAGEPHRPRRGRTALRPAPSDAARTPMNSALTRGRRALGCVSVCSRRKSHTGESGVSLSGEAILRTFPSAPHVRRARCSCLQSMGKPSSCTGTPRAPPAGEPHRPRRGRTALHPAPSAAARTPMNSALTRGRRALGCVSVCSSRKSHTGESGVSLNLHCTARACVNA